MKFFDLLGEGTAGGLRILEIELIRQNSAIAMRPFKGIDKGRRLVAVGGLAQGQRAGLKIAGAVGDKNGGFRRLRRRGNALCQMKATAAGRGACKEK